MGHKFELPYRRTTPVTYEQRVVRRRRYRKSNYLERRERFLCYTSWEGITSIHLNTGLKGMPINRSPKPYLQKRAERKTHIRQLLCIYIEWYDTEFMISRSTCHGTNLKVESSPFSSGSWTLELILNYMPWFFPTPVDHGISETRSGRTYRIWRVIWKQKTRLWNIFVFVRPFKWKSSTRVRPETSTRIPGIEALCMGNKQSALDIHGNSEKPGKYWIESADEFCCFVVFLFPHDASSLLLSDTVSGSPCVSRMAQNHGI